MDRATELLSKAIQENKLYSFLIGDEGYYLINEYANTPTDPFLVLRAVVKLKDLNPNLIYELIENIKKMSKDKQYNWWSLFYVYNIMLINKELGVKNIEEIVSEIVININSQKEILKRNKNWIGAQYEDGLWEVLLRFSKTLNEDYNLSIQFK